jgi:peptide/nickel transport system ATP-binding protein/oligopeptide transport system ATP-binding protein
MLAAGVGYRMTALLRAEQIVKVFERGVRAVDGVSLDIARGETLSIVGETGSGKTTLARCLARLVPVSSGRVLFEGRDISTSSEEDLKPVRRRMQMVFQDPLGALNPRRTLGASIREPLVIHGVGDANARGLRARECLEMVGLSPEHESRFPAELSGGQLQRACIARAIVLEPSLLICDEPVSALDVSIRAQILNLFEDLRARLALTCVFISHDLAVVRHLSDRVAIMRAGSIVETGPVNDIFANPQHEYTRQLLDAVLGLDPVAARARMDAAVS